MNATMQSYFKNELYSDVKHAEFLTELNRACGIPIEFRVAEMPIFIGKDMQLKLEQSAVDIIKACIDPHHISYSTQAIPDAFNVPNQTQKPLFSVIDFAITQDTNGEYQPKVVELQGFPSLFGYQLRYIESVCNVYGLKQYSGFPGRIDAQYFTTILRESLIGKHDPDETCLLEYKPDQQKTRPDFSVIEQLTGMKTTDIESIKQEGNALYHQRNGKWVRIRRIFNRAIADELVEKSAKVPFDWRDALDIEWAGHPNWYFLISKQSLPLITHKAIPKTLFLSELTDIPTSLEPFVLKPLFAFAGKGVNMNPQPSDIDLIPINERSEYILQEKINYADCIDTPFGANKVEIRIMLIWPEHEESPIPVMSLARTGRGPMMGVRYNNIPWTGSSGCLFG
ncbi:MAG: hypothetical protein ACO3GR_04960 [Candidatus Kapaibacteriota bacterium]